MANTRRVMTLDIWVSVRLPVFVEIDGVIDDQDADCDSESQSISLRNRRPDDERGQTVLSLGIRFSHCAVVFKFGRARPWQPARVERSDGF